MLDQYAKQSAYSDPGRYGYLLDQLPTDLRELTAVVRNLVVHYRDPAVRLDLDRMAEIDLRWVEQRLVTDQLRFGAPLAEPRPYQQRVAGCCRDFTLHTVSALRHRGIPARSRVGFAGYLAPDWHFDHVVAEYWDGDRWVRVDAQLDPAAGWPFDTHDLGTGFDTAAQVWTAYRRGELDAERYGVAPDLPLKGHRFVLAEVVIELAHRQRDELLLWDLWGFMLSEPDSEPDPEVDALVDEIAALLLAADAGDRAAEAQLAARYADDPRLRPGERVLCLSPTGRHAWVDLVRRFAASPR
jgi:hypothetical protein